MRTVAEIMDLFGGLPAFHRFFKVPRQTCHTWRRRNRLPPSMDVLLVEEAERRKINLTYADLARMRAAEKSV